MKGYEEKLKKSHDAEKAQRDQELNDIRTVLATKSGRRLVWRLLGKCRVFGSVWDGSAKVHYNSGQQDIGHYLMAEVLDADENLWFKMMSENRADEQRKKNKEEQDHE